MKRLLQINPVIRVSTSTGRIMNEIGELAIRNGWESYIAYSKGRDGVKSSSSHIVPVGSRLSVVWHGVMTRLFDRHGLSSNYATKKFIRQIERIKPDVIHIHNIHGYFLNYKLLFDYLSKSGIPVIWTVHDCWLYTGHCYYYSYAGCDKWQRGCGNCPQQRKFPASLLLDRSRRNFIDKKEAFTSVPASLMKIVPVSEWIREQMAHSFLKGCNFEVIHNGIDINIFQPTPDSDIKAKYALSGKKHIILGVASIWSEEKGWDDFMQLSTMLNDDEVIVLVGVDDDRKRLLPDNVVGISRTENIAELAALYSVADVFVNPTWQDNYPTVNLESIACGTPVVTYRTGGSIEAITPQTGVIIEQGDVRGILNAVRDIEKKGKEYFCEGCRQYAISNFNKEERYADYLRLYDEMLSLKL